MSVKGGAERELASKCEPDSAAAACVFRKRRDLVSLGGGPGVTAGHLEFRATSKSTEYRVSSVAST
eukprot:5410623-Prymnesium_polylepis.1